MKITKNKASFALAALVILAVFNVIAFVIPFERIGSFWVGYGAMMLALLVSFCTAGYAFRDDSAASKFYGIPLVAVVWYYLLIQLACSFIFMIFSGIPVGVSCLVCVLVFAGTILGLIATDLTKGEVERIDRHVQQKTFYLKSMQVDAETMASTAPDPILRKALRALADDIRYSDPMSHDSLASLEEKIESKTAELGELVAGGNTEAARQLCTQLQGLLTERNKKCKLLK